MTEIIYGNTDIPDDLYGILERYDTYKSRRKGYETQNSDGVLDLCEIEPLGGWVQFNEFLQKYGVSLKKVSYDLYETYKMPELKSEIKK